MSDKHDGIGIHTRNLQILNPHDVDRNDLLKLKALKIVGAQSENRISSYGGYYDQCAFINDIIVIASLTHDNEPDLTIETVAKFVADNEEWLDEMNDEENDDNDDDLDDE